MVDLDHFKILNDTYGHETGDRSLVLFAQMLKDSFRLQDLCCRYGGEEFAIAFPSCTAVQARNALDAFRSRLSAAITVAGLPTFTVSAGIVDFKIHETLPDALARADAALYQAKQGGVTRQWSTTVMAKPYPKPQSSSNSTRRVERWPLRVRIE
jgi:diguanylate cyclase (GGDEF)-like protein